MKTLKEIDKKVAHSIRTKTGSFPFHTDKVNLKWTEGGWGLINLTDLYTRLHPSTLIDKILNRNPTTSSLTIQHILQELAEENKEIVGTREYQGNNCPPAIKHTWKILRELNLQMYDTTINQLSPLNFFGPTQNDIIQRAKDKNINNILQIPQKDPQSVANYLISRFKFPLTQLQKTPIPKVTSRTQTLEDTRLVWTDGSIRDKDKKEGTYAIYYGKNHPHNKAISMPNCYSSFTAEAKAIHRAILECPETTPLKIITDSLSVKDAIQQTDTNPLIQDITNQINQRRTNGVETDITHIYSHIKKKKRKGDKWKEKIKTQEKELYPHFRKFRQGNKKADKLSAKPNSPEIGIPPHAAKYSLMDSTGVWIQEDLNTNLKRSQNAKKDKITKERDTLRHPQLPNTNTHLSQLCLKSHNSKAGELNFLIKARNLCLPVPDRFNKPDKCHKCQGSETHAHILLTCPQLAKYATKIKKQLTLTALKQGLPGIIAATWFDGEIPLYMWILGYIPKQWAKRMKNTVGREKLERTITIFYKISIRITLRVFKAFMKSKRASQRN